MASKDSANDDEIPSLNSIPPPEEGGGEEVTRVGSHAEIQKALEAEKPGPKPAAGTPATKAGENIKTPTVPLPAVEIDTLAKVGKTDKIVEELEDSALEAAAPSQRPGAPPLPAGARKKTGSSEDLATKSSTDAATTSKGGTPAKSNSRMIIVIGIAVAFIVIYLATR